MPGEKLGALLKALGKGELYDIHALFRYHSSHAHTNLVNLACGHFFGAREFRHFFPHPKNKLYAIDNYSTKHVMWLHQQNYVKFLESNLDEFNPNVIDILQRCQVWIARHPCLATNAIIELFSQCAASQTTLYLLPCYCTASSVENPCDTAGCWCKQRKKKQRDVIQLFRNKNMQYQRVTFYEPMISQTLPRDLFIVKYHSRSSF
jgi:hypothetical protein